MIDFKELTWRSTSFLCSRAYQITNAKTFIFSNSVLCVGKMGDDPSAAWKKRIQRIITSRNWIASTVCRRSSSGKCCQDSRRWTSSKRFKKLWKVHSVNLSSSTTGSSSCQCTTTLYGEKKGNTEKCVQISITIAKYARRFPRGRWSFLGPGSEKKWYGTYSEKPDGIWDRTAEMMMLQLHTESGHPIFRASSAFKRGELRSKGHGKKSIHFNGSEETSSCLSAQ